MLINMILSLKYGVSNFRKKKKKVKGYQDIIIDNKK